jgi:tetratricopeptide (TPR) repeat protein
MGKGSPKKKKKPIHEGHADKSRSITSSESPITPQIEKGLQKSLSKSPFLLFIIIILITSFAVYFNALSNDFVYDDKGQVLENHWIKDIKFIPEIFSGNVWSFQKEAVISNYYRPLMHLIYMLTHYIFGLKPWGFHLVNILFHAGVSVLVFIIGLRLLSEAQHQASASHMIPSFIAALLFATHPIHTEAVTWVAGLTDLSFTFFYLLAFYLYIQSGTDFKGAYLFSVASFFLASLCKEPALTLPIILIAYDYTFKKYRYRISNYIMRYVPYLIVAGVYFILRSHALGGFAPQKRHVELSTYQYFINIFPLFMQYLEKLILPINLNAFHVLHPVYSFTEAKAILSFIIAAAFVVLIFITLKKNRSIFLSLLFILIPLLPVLYIPFLGENTFAERYLYLPSVGFVFLAALLLTWAKANRPPKETVGLILMFAVLIGMYSFGTAGRNTIWRDNDILYADMLKKSPDAALPHYCVGEQLLRKGLVDEAIEQFQVTLKIDPYFLPAYENLGVAFVYKGWLDEAIEQYQIALKLYPDSADVHNGIAVAFLDKGWTDKALEHFQIALKLNPDLADAHNNLGLIYQMSGSIDKAIYEFQAAIRSDPSDPSYRSNLTKAYELKKFNQ